jgi:O-acetyl-ADP-ribose deacetylase (regulator of RNase III)
MLVFETRKMIGPKYIINFPTKQHWRGNSKYEYILSGLEGLIAEVRYRGIRSVALPPLGCGLGGLDWNRVRPMIEASFASLPNVEVLLFEPAGAPEAKTMPIGAPRPKRVYNHR